jgi:hypothetical protein
MIWLFSVFVVAMSSVGGGILLCRLLWGYRGATGFLLKHVKYTFVPKLLLPYELGEQCN